MKKKFLKFSLGTIRKYNPDIDDVKLDELRYGLEGFYLTIVKALIIIPLAFILGVGKELLIMLVFYNVLRDNACGLHANKSSVCLFSSLIVFILVPYFSKIIFINFNLKIILMILAIILIYIYAPADTVKAPIIKKTKRDKLKFKSTIITIFYSLLVIFIKNEIITNLIIFATYTEIILILPITYKIFNLSYNNYKDYIAKYNLD